MTFPLSVGLETDRETLPDLFPAVGQGELALVALGGAHLHAGGEVAPAVQPGIDRLQNLLGFLLRRRDRLDVEVDPREALSPVEVEPVLARLAPETDERPGWFLHRLRRRDAFADDVAQALVVEPGEDSVGVVERHHFAPVNRAFSREMIFWSSAFIAMRVTNEICSLNCVYACLRYGLAFEPGCEPPLDWYVPTESLPRFSRGRSSSLPSLCGRVPPWMRWS